MKFKTTRKEALDKFYCQSVDYGDLQFLLATTNPIAYTSGVYGWNADIYINGNLAIVMGYRPFGKKYITDNELHNFNKTACEIRCDKVLSWDEKRAHIEALLNEFWELFRHRIFIERD